MVPEAMRAAYILKKEFGYETRVLNVHTLKPIDEEAILRAAQRLEPSSPPRSIRLARWPGASAAS